MSRLPGDLKALALGLAGLVLMLVGISIDEPTVKWLGAGVLFAMTVVFLVVIFWEYLHSLSRPGQLRRRR